MVNRERLFFFKAGLIFYAVWLLSFATVGTFASKLPTRDITSALDRHIPLVADFIWLYELCYIFPFFPLLVLKDWHQFNRALLAVIIGNLLAFVVYLAFPIAFPRPELGKGLSESILALEYRFDFKPGANKLPSLHVAFTWIVYLACRRQRLSRLGESAVFTIAAFITISTVFVKQHLVIDAVAGCVWAGGAWGLAKCLYPRLVDPHQEARPAFKQMMKRMAPLALILFILIMLGAGLYWKNIIPW